MLPRLHKPITPLFASMITMSQTTTTTTPTATTPTATFITPAEKPGSSSQLSPEHKSIVEAVLKLYQCDVSEENFRYYTDDVEFEDPIACAKGIRDVKAQWFTMPKAFSKSETLQADAVLEKNPDRIQINLQQRYTMRPFGNTFTMPSTTVLYLDPTGLRVTRHEDLWHHKPLSKGGISEYFRGVNGSVVGYFFAPKSNAPPSVSS